MTVSGVSDGACVDTEAISDEVLLEAADDTSDGATDTTREDSTDWVCDAGEIRIPDEAIDCVFTPQAENIEKINSSGRSNANNRFCRFMIFIPPM